MADVLFLRLAKADFDTAFDWYAERSHNVAIRFDDAIRDALERIAREPERFAMIDGIHRQGRVKRFPFRIVFRHDGDHLIVVAVAHHRRQSGYWRSKDEPS
jgi:plasmid stabilization system protein ParE